MKILIDNKKIWRKEQILTYFVNNENYSPYSVVDVPGKILLKNIKLNKAHDYIKPVWEQDWFVLNYLSFTVCVVPRTTTSIDS